MEVKNVKTILSKLRPFDFLCNEHDYISITEWSNGEGVLVDINNQRVFNLSYSELDAIYYLTRKLMFENENTN